MASLRPYCPTGFFILALRYRTICPQILLCNEFITVPKLTNTATQFHTFRDYFDPGAIK